MFSMMLLYVYVFYWFACFCYVTPIVVMHGLKVTAEVNKIYLLATFWQIEKSNNKTN